jgi:hypothetical protein
MMHPVATALTLIYLHFERSVCSNIWLRMEGKTEDYGGLGLAVVCFLVPF